MRPFLRTLLPAAAFMAFARPVSSEPVKLVKPEQYRARVVAAKKGRVVLVNFWATWCVPCREEFPDLVRLESASRSRGLTVIGVSTDLAKDSAAVEKFLATNNPGFANYRKKSGGDDQDFIDAVDPRWGGELPYSVLYGRDGRKAEVLSGKQTYAELERKISRLLR